MRTCEFLEEPENLASVELESRLTPDPYFYIFSPQKQLISPRSMLPVINFLAHTTPLEIAEHDAFEKLEKWTAKNNSGYTLWISPPDKASDYLFAKFTVSQIVNNDGFKTLDNTAIITNQTREQCLQIGKFLAEYSKYSLDFQEPIDNIEELRATPIPFVSPQGGNWIDFLSQYFGKTETWEKIRTSVHLQEKEEARAFWKAKFTSLQNRMANAITHNERQEIYREIIDQIQSRGITQNSPRSCPLSFLKQGAYTMTLNNSQVFFEIENSFPCPRCSLPIPSGLGITTCPHCGARKEDFGRCD